MVNTCERFINTVTIKEPKMLIGSNQKVRSQDMLLKSRHIIAKKKTIGKIGEPKSSTESIRRNVITPYIALA